MNNTPTASQILDKIRDVAGLRRLELGTQIYLTKDKKLQKDQYSDNDMIHTVYQIEEDMISAYTIYDGEWMDVEMTPDYIDNCEIIGLPVHLEHLLRAIGESNLDNDETGVCIDVGGENLLVLDKDPLRVRDSAPYDLTKSVEANLESEELRRVIGDLLGMGNIRVTNG